MIFRRKPPPAPSLAELVLGLVRGRDVTGDSPIEFTLADGRAVTLVIHPEDVILQPEEAKWILEMMMMQDGDLPHNGGEWPPYGVLDKQKRIVQNADSRFSNEFYLKLLRIAGIPIDPIWRLPAK